MFVKPKGLETAWEYARRLGRVANEAGEDVEGEFNGTPVTAKVGMTHDEICNDWSTRRAKIQQDDFECETRTFAETVVGKKIASAVAMFTTMREPAGVLFHLDDGSSFVADGVKKQS